MALNGYNPQNTQGFPQAQGDPIAVVRKNQLNQAGEMDNMRRTLSEQSNELGLLRGLLQETLTKATSPAPSQNGNGTSSSSSNWADAYGGSPAGNTQPTQQQVMQFTPEQLDQMMDQKLAQRERQRRESQLRAQQQQQQEADRLHMRLYDERPDWVQNERIMKKIAWDWQDAKALNDRAAPENRMTADQLYQVVVARVERSLHDEAQYQMQLQAQQDQSQQAGPLPFAHRRQPEPQGPPEYLQANGHAQPYQPSAYAGHQPPSPYEAPNGPQRLPYDPSRGRSHPMDAPAPQQHAPVSPYATGGNMYAPATAQHNAQQYFGAPSGDANYDTRMHDFQQKRLRQPIHGG